MNEFMYTPGIPSRPICDVTNFILDSSIIWSILQRKFLECPILTSSVDKVEDAELFFGNAHIQCDIVMKEWPTSHDSDEDHHDHQHERGDQRTASYRWTGWIQETTDWRSKTSVNYPSFLRNLWNIPLKLAENNRTIPTCNRLHLETRGFRPIMSSNLPGPVIGWDPSVCKSNRLHVDILRFSFTKLGYIVL